MNNLGRFSRVIWVRDNGTNFYFVPLSLIPIIMNLIENLGVPICSLPIAGCNCVSVSTGGILNKTV